MSVYDFRIAVSSHSSVRRAIACVALLLFTLFATGLSAQERGAISGRVVTADGEPVTDAVVTVVTAGGARTRVDESGRFTVTALPPGPHLLEISSVRHARGLERVTVVAGETVEVEILLVSGAHSEQIVVTASPDLRGELDLGAPVNVLDSQELALRLEPSLGETLSQEAGISSTYFAPGASRPVIRGLGGDRVKMMENGLDTLDASSASPDHAVAVDPLGAERIEVLRGPATLLYGSNAIGGVVNVLDGRIPTRRPAESFSGTADVRAGSAANERAAAVDMDGGRGPWAWRLDLLGRETDDVEIPGRAPLAGEEHEAESPTGVLPNSDVESRGAGAGVTHFFGDRGFLGVSVRGLESDYGIPGGHAHEDGEEEMGEGELGEEEHREEGLRIDLRQRRYDLEGAITQPFGVFAGARLRLGLVDYEHAELEGPGVVGTEFFNDAWEGRIELVQRARGAHTGSFGLQVRSRDLEAIGEEAFLLPAASESLGLFTFQELGAGPVRFQAGVRYETQETAVREPVLPDRDFDGLSASFGIVYKPGAGYSLGASLARSVKMPSTEELYSNGLHVATSSFELGDPGLEEESALGLDLSLRKTEGRLTGSINLFYNDFADYIFQAFTGDEVEGFPVLQWSQADARFWGAELELSMVLAQRAHSSWDLDLVWDGVRAELDAGSPLPRIPPQRYGVGVHYRSDRLRGGVELRLVDDQERVAENETPTDGYTMLDADLSYRLVFTDSYLDLILRGTNLTDEEARSHTSFVKDDVPLPGRNVSLVARFGF